MLVFGIYEPTSPIRVGVSLTTRKQNGWSLPTPMVIDGYYNINTLSTFFMSGDGNCLLFSVEREEGFGERDIYISFRQGEYNWSKPLNLGKSVNTSKDDDSPFLASDNTTLYFASEGRGGYGSTDIFYTKRLDDTWTKWSEPVNMGPEINTAGKDYHFRLPASGEYAYMVSTNPERGDRDIYRIKLVTEKPNPVVLVYGKVLDSLTKKPLESKILLVANSSTTDTVTAVSSPIDGTYSIILSFGKKYSIMAYTNGYFPVNDYIDLNIDPSYKEIQKNFLLKKIDSSFNITISDTRFEHDSYILKDDEYENLSKIVYVLNKNPEYTILIEGHTDNTGTYQYNMELSKKRAQSVADYLIERKIDSKRIQTKGYGATKPIAPNEQEEGRALNRRVELHIFSNQK
jgi:outer membrane protein OmpA-like peptidoglycan-associated protein